MSRRARDLHTSLADLQHRCPSLVADARIVAGMLWKYRAEFWTMVTYDQLVELAVSEVWMVQQAEADLTQTQRVSKAMLRLRRELRRSRARLHLPADEFEENTLLEQLAQRDLLRRLQENWTAVEWAELLEVLDDSQNCKELALKRKPNATERELAIEHGRVRKLKRRLLLRARRELEAMLQADTP